MSLIEKQIIDKIEVVGDAFPMVQVRRADVIEKDGVEIARSFHRHVLAPGDDISHEDPKVQAVCAAVWTDDVVAAYQAHLQSQSDALLPSGADA
jgi:urease accessory protein UreE